MRWFEYKAEVDALHAPEDLKARLRAMKAPGETSCPAKDRTPPASITAPLSRGHADASANKRPLHFPWKRLGGLAACFICGAAVTLLALGTRAVWPSFMLSSAAGQADNASNNTAVAPGAAEGMSFSDSAGGGSLLSGNDAWLTADTDTAHHENFTASGENRAETPSAEQNRSQPKSAQTARKIIYTASLTLESTEYDQTDAALLQALDAAGGYVESSEGSNYGSSERTIRYTLRVPAENYRSFLSAAEGAGNLTDKCEDSQDITAAYVDVAARIETLQAQRARLLELEAQAETLADLLEIEEKLSGVQYQLESYQQQMAVYNDQVDYCTVNVWLQEVTIYTPVEPTLGQQLSGALTGGFKDFIAALLAFALWLLAALPWLALLAAALIIVQVFRRRKKRGAE